MARDTVREIIREFVRVRQQALGCITESRLSFPADYRPLIEYTLLLNKNVPVPLHGRATLQLRITQSYYAVAEPTPVVALLSYDYTLLNEQGQEAVAYHWQPAERVKEPHLHVSRHLSRREKLGDVTLRKVHLPTGYATIADVCRLLVRDFRVRPLQRNWRGLLDQARSAELLNFPAEAFQAEANEATTR